MLLGLVDLGANSKGSTHATPDGEQEPQQPRRRLNSKGDGDSDATHHRRPGTSNHSSQSKVSISLGLLPLSNQYDDDESAKKLKKGNIYWTKDIILNKALRILFALWLIWNIYAGLRRLYRYLQGEQLPPDATLDFLIAGFPKSGTTTLLATLRKHKEIVMDSEENCQIARPIQQDDVNLKRLNRYLDALKKDDLTARSATENRSSYQRVSNVGTQLNDDLKFGIKCPDAVKNFKAIHRLSQHSPNCKFVIGVRHPVLFLQSFYNYRVVEAHSKNRVNEGIPSLYEIWDGNMNWWDISPDAPRFELFLSQFGKTDLTVSQMRQWFADRPMLAVKPNRFHIFLYSMEQLQDVTQSDQLRTDLQLFLGLKMQIPAFGHENKIWGRDRFNGTIDICNPEFDRIRESVLHHAKATVQWMHEFLGSADVVVSNLPYLRDSIDRWTLDPCAVSSS